MKAYLPRIAALLAIDIPFFAALGAGGAYFGLLEPRIGFLVFGLGLLVGSLAALVVGCLGLVFSPGGRGPSLVGVVSGAAGLFLLAFLLLPNLDAPMIHDITTHPDDPPRFHAIAELPANAGRDLTYPHGGGDVVAQQRKAYPDLAPLRLDAAPDTVLETVQAAVRELGWTVVAVDEAGGIVEAYDTSKVFRFIDDVVIRVRADGTGSVVDVRSTSRVGKSDLGANARRIRKFLMMLKP